MTETYVEITEYANVTVILVGSNMFVSGSKYAYSLSNVIISHLLFCLLLVLRCHIHYLHCVCIRQAEGHVTVVKQFCLTDWGETESVPNNKRVFIELLGMIEKWQQQNVNGPITVHCS